MNKKKTIFFIVSLLYFSLIVYILVNSLPFNPLKSSVKNVVKIRTIFPEGWAFFTKDSREEVLKLYKVDTLRKDLLLIDVKRSSDISNVFGLKKDSRYLGVIMAALEAQTDTEEWLKVKELKYDTVLSMKPKKVFNDAPFNPFKGLYLFQKQKPVPWAWRESQKNLEMPSEIRLIEIDDKVKRYN